MDKEHMESLEKEVKAVAQEIFLDLMKKYEGRPAGIIAMALALTAGGFTASATEIPRDVFLECAAVQYDTTKKLIAEGQNAAR